jgi:hypothetical protein
MQYCAQNDETPFVLNVDWYPSIYSQFTTMRTNGRASFSLHQARRKGSCQWHLHREQGSHEITSTDPSAAAHAKCLTPSALKLFIKEKS